jgi:hypothetical protein
MWATVDKQPWWTQGRVNQIYTYVKATPIEG